VIVRKIGAHVHINAVLDGIIRDRTVVSNEYLIEFENEHRKWFGSLDLHTDREWEKLVKSGLLEGEKRDLTQLELFRPHLQEGIDFLNSEQPEDAVLDHLGIGSYDVKIPGLRLIFVVNTHSSVSGIPIVSIQAREKSKWYRRHDSDYQDFFTEEDCTILREFVGTFARITDEWNGPKATNFGLHIDVPLSKSVWNASRNYGKTYGKPEHNELRKRLIKPEGWY
jgi:hypothetical protein